MPRSPHQQLSNTGLTDAHSHLLTIVLPLRGRYFYTEFWLNYALKARFPYKIILADGSKEDATERLVEGGANLYGALNVEYLRFPFDASYPDYYAKVLDALSRVRTKYVMLLDNDTFPMPSSIEDCVDFMERNADYSCCRGTHVDYDYDESDNLIADGVYFDKNEKDSGIHKNFGQSTAIERIENWVEHTHILYYNVHRIENMLKAWSTIDRIGFLDLTMTDLSIALHSLISGKSRVLDGVFLMRHRGSPESASAEMIRKADFLDRVLTPKWTQDLADLVDELSLRACHQDGLGATESLARIRAAVKIFQSNRLYLHLHAKRNTSVQGEPDIKRITLADVEGTSRDAHLFALLGSLAAHPVAREAERKTGRMRV